MRDLVDLDRHIRLCVVVVNSWASQRILGRVIRIPPLVAGVRGGQVLPHVDQELFRFGTEAPTGEELEEDVKEGIVLLASESHGR